MARGQKLKQEVMQKLLDTFSGSFLYNDGKELRICGQEDGEDIQIKVTLTAAKENVVPGGENALPGTTAIKDEQINFEDKPKETPVVEPTDEERQNVSELLRALGL